MSVQGISEEVLKWNSEFIDSLENVDSVIKDASMKQPSPFVNRIKRGSAPLGEGLDRAYWLFHSGAMDMSGLVDWRAVARGNPASEGTPGQDVCADYPSTIVDAGFEKRSYTAYETFRRTRDICLNNIKWNWQFEQQLAMYYKWIGNVSIRVWENLGRESCMYLGERFVLTSDTNPDAVTVAYNPFTSKNATCAGGTTPVEMNKAFFERMLILNQMEAPDSAIAMISGFPSWGLIVDPFDFDRQVLREEDTREELLYAAPSVLIDGIGTLKTWRNWTMMYNGLLPRWTYNAGTFTRVDPYIAEATTKGERQVVNPAYLSATHGTFFVWSRDPVQFLLPQENPANIAGMNFGVMPKHNGDFTFLNIQDAVTNPLMEKGHFFGRFQSFVKGGETIEQMKTYIYKR